MSKILELREKRAKAWETAKAFLDAKRGADGLLAAEDVATYEKMEADVVNLGKEIDRLERQAALDAELSKPVNTPLTGKPAAPAGEEKTGRASAEYRRSFWNAMRSKMPSHEIMNALQIGTDSEGGYLVPDEYERTLVEALEEQNIFRTLAHVIQTSSGDRKIPVVASKGTASWVDEEGTIPESDDAFSQVSIGAYKLATLVKVSEELLNDSVFDLEAYISREFARRIGNKEEEAFFTGDGTGKPLGVLAATGGAEIGVTAASATAFTADEVFDLFAIRIIIDCPQEQEKAQCWAIYSIVTDFYTPNPDRMRDWISIPKSNGYESLHTTVVSNEGRWVEIQIRSERMDEVAERGVAAHWRYKGVSGGTMGTEEWFTKLREIMETTQPQEIAQKFDAKLSSGEIFVFTPNGDLRKLSEGATVLDFAFDIHTNLGATCVGGKVNHRNVSFREVLRNGDIVEILTSKTQKPKADWLNIVTTSKARNKIRAYMREEQAKAASLGREELERKIKNWKLSITMDDAVMVLSKYYKLRTGTELYGQIAQQKIILPDIKEILTRHLNGTLDDGHPLKAPSAAKIVSDNDDALIIDNSLSNIEYKLAKCCNPIFGDEIFGFTTINSGITIHRQDCPNAQRLKERYPYRVLPARWQQNAAKGAFVATVRIQAEDATGLVNKIAEVINRDLKINIRSMSLNSSGGMLSGLINIEVTGTQLVDAVVYSLMRIKGVQKVFRVNK